MDLWQLHIFVSVVQKKSFSKASEAINLSQPTVSTHIKELEEHFQCRLLDRLGKTTEPTRAGMILYDHAKQLLGLRDLTESAMLDFLGHTKGELNIGGSTIPAGYIIPKPSAHFPKNSPMSPSPCLPGIPPRLLMPLNKEKLNLGWLAP